MGIKDLASIAQEFRAPAAEPAIKKPRAQSAPVALMEFSAEFKRLAEEREQLLASQGRPQEVALDDLVESPLHAQVRRLDVEQVDALVENLRSNPLATPIVVRRLPSGRFEIIAGRHRAQAFRALGKTHIPAVVVEMADDAVARAIVFDNLITPQLTDFERYRSIAELRQRFGWTYTELERETGFSRGWIAALLAFDKLPEEAREVLKARPSLMSAKQLSDLLGAAREPEILLSAVEALDRGESFEAVMRRIAPAQKRTTGSSERVEIRPSNARARAATFSHRGNTIVVRVDKSRLQHIESLQQRLLQAVQSWAQDGQEPA